MLKKYSHPIVFISCHYDEILYDKSAGFAAAEIEFKVFKHPYFWVIVIGLDSRFNYPFVEHLILIIYLYPNKIFYLA